jgi:RNA polymerase sigma-70 factor (ECF subfamily)
MLCRYFAVRGLDSSTAEELVQDVLLTVYRRSSEVRNPQCFTGWMFQVARNSLLQHARKRHALFESLTGREYDRRMLGSAPSNCLMLEETEIFEWMQILEEDEKEICLMRYVDGLDYQSIAQALDAPMGTVKWKLHRIKKKIAAQLGLSKMEAQS